MYWIYKKRHRFIPADNRPATQPERPEKASVQKCNLTLALEKRQEREKTQANQPFLQEGNEQFSQSYKGIFPPCRHNRI